MGIQTVCYTGEFWWFGCYGFPQNKAIFKADKSFGIVGEYDIDFSVGIAGLPDKKFLRGFSWRDDKSKKWKGKVKFVSHPFTGELQKFEVRKD